MCWERGASRRIFKLAIMQFSRGCWWQHSNHLLLFIKTRKKTHSISSGQGKSNKDLYCLYFPKPLNLKRIDRAQLLQIKEGKWRIITDVYCRMLGLALSLPQMAKNEEGKNCIWKNLEKIRTMVIKALVTHCYLFRVLHISRLARWVKDKKKKKAVKEINTDMLSNYVLKRVRKSTWWNWKERERWEGENMNCWEYAKILVIPWVYPERLVLFLRTHSFKEKNNFLAEVISGWS